MSELQKQLEKYKKEGEAIVQKLRERLAELDEERADIIDQISVIEGKPVNGNYKPNLKSRQLGKTIRNLLKEAGSDGLVAADIFEGVTSEIPGTPRQNVLTQLSRMKRNKELKVKGKHGSSVYILLNSK